MFAGKVSLYKIIVSPFFILGIFLLIGTQHTEQLVKLLNNAFDAMNDHCFSKAVFSSTSSKNKAVN